jgi:16S rRNA (uracil1498-N3)-methyltransferase
MAHRFFLKENLNREFVVIKDKALLHQIRTVLRIQKGEFVVFFNTNKDCVGFDYYAELKNNEKSSIVFMMREKKENNRKSVKKLTLYQALPKKEAFEEILQHCTEVGVSEFVPIVAGRSQKKSFQRTRCENILKEASEQSGRGDIPLLRDTISFDDAINEAIASGDKVYFTSISERENIIKPTGERSISLFIGPEGGWGEKELIIAQNRGCEVISLGRSILRSETAAVSASYTLLWV